MDEASQTPTPPAPPAIECPAPVEPSINDLRQDAARGSIRALSALCDVALSGIHEGKLESDAGLSAAEILASLAAAGGGPAERWNLVSLLAARASRFLAAGEQGRSMCYQREVARHLRKLDAQGDENATAALADLDFAVSEIDPYVERLAASSDATLADAAAGDPRAYDAVIDGCILGYNGGFMQPGHALAMAEEVALLAACTGHLPLVTKLAGVLALRGFYEWEHGGKANAASAMTEAVNIALIALDAGDQSVAASLPPMIDQLPEPLLAAVVQAHPGALIFRTSAGAA